MESPKENLCDPCPCPSGFKTSIGKVGGERIGSTKRKRKAQHVGSANAAEPYRIPRNLRKEEHKTVRFERMY